MLRYVGRVFPPVLLACGLTAWLSGCGSRTPGPAPEEEKPAVPVAIAAEPPHPPKGRPKRKAQPRPETARTVQPPAEGKKAPPPAVEQKPAVVEEGPPVPQDRAGKMVADLLRPSEAAFAPKSGRSAALAGPRALEQPELPPLSYAGDVLRLPMAVVAKPLRPRHLADEVPLVRVRSDYRLPGPVALPVVVLVREPAPDVEKPPPLPILARPQSDHAATGDPTAEASQAAALAGDPPVRTTPTPFDRPGIPDPFENRHTVRLRTAPPEAPVSPQLLPRTPAKDLPVTGK